MVKAAARTAAHIPAQIVSVGLSVGMLAALLLWPTATAGADAMASVAHPELDYAGSQIAKHEGTALQSSPIMPKETQTPGFDVSSYQASVDWQAVTSHGGKFVYVKASEGVDYTNPSFSAQYTGAGKAGLVRGAYHFALPDKSDGVTQANYFLSHGGQWARDGKTLPPAVDLEYDPQPHSDSCYMLPADQMVSWISAFSNRVHQLTGRYPMIYTSLYWWQKCTGNTNAFAKTNPLWIARYNKDIGDLPNGWTTHAIWQFADKGTFPGDQDTFNGPLSALTSLARG